jgi:PTH2 family peptidyl-tRNA hydrolase
MSYLSVEECLKIEDIESLVEQIRQRRELIKTMVGNLYPRIVYTEIDTIDQHIYRLREGEPKQVIVIRKDLNMRKGKMVAQGSHASLGVILHMMNTEEHTHFDGVTPITIYTLHADGYVRDWLTRKFTKVCVSVDSEAELLAVYEKAQELGIPSVLITDSGLTEFAGKPTNTCCGIGPWRRSEIDAITGHLKLL